MTPSLYYHSTEHKQLWLVQVAEVISTSEQLELNPSRTRLRRTDPLDPEAAIEVVDGRSIYAKPFPFDVTLDGLMQFWNKVGPPNSRSACQSLTLTQDLPL